MKRGTKSIVLAAFFCALTAVMAQLIIPISPVPVSLGVMAVYLTGLLLDKKTAFQAQLAYLLLGAAGAPVFSGLTGGLGKLAGPTGGYLLVYPAMAFLIALSAEKWGRGILSSILSMTGVLFLLCYPGGSLWLALSTGVSFSQALAAGAAPFVLLDLLKLLVTALFASSLQSALSHAGLLPVPTGKK